MVITYLEQIIQAIQDEEDSLCVLQRVSMCLRSETTKPSQCIICEVSLRNCKGYIGVVYRCPSLDNAEFGNFLIVGKGVHTPFF